jgi:hypothetical protein
MPMDPIFVGGMQRSGTSLMRAIIGSHPDVAMFEWDLPLWTDFLGRFQGRPLSDPTVLKELLDGIFAHEKYQGCDVQLDRAAIEERIAAAGSVSCGLVFQCFLEEYARALGRPRWGLKTPHNEFFADDIFAAHPTARMVQLIRDPRDVAVSYQSYDGGSWDYSARDHLAQWKRSLELAQQHARRYEGRYLAVRYEDLVTHPEATIRRVCAIVDLDFRPCLLEASGHLGWEGANSFFNDVGRDSKTISTAGIGRYRTRLRPDLILLYQRQLRPELLQWGYNLERFSPWRRAVIGVRSFGHDAGTSLRNQARASKNCLRGLLQKTPLYAPASSLYRCVFRRSSS